MYKMLIVEDEEIEREGLIHYVDWTSMGIEIVAAVESGEEALEYALKEKVDILFTDIRLLGITGLELAKKMISIYPQLRVVILSGYQDFEYAKEAVELQVFSFLTKPVEIDELERLFRKMVDQCKVEEQEQLEKKKLTALVKKNMPLLKERFFNDLIQGTLSEEDIAKSLEYLGVCLEGSFFNTLLWDIDNYDVLVKDLSTYDTHLKVIRVLDIINCTENEFGVVSFHISKGLFCSIISSSVDNRDVFYEWILDYAQKIQNKVNKLCQLDLTVGIGREVQKLSDLKISYQHACDTLNFKFYMGTNQIIHYNDVCSNFKQNRHEDLEKIVEKIMTSVRVCDREKMEDSISEFFSVVREGGFSDIYIRSLCANLLSKISVMLLDMHESYEKILGNELEIWERLLKLDTLTDIQRWIQDIFNQIIQYLLEKKKGNNRRIVEDIIKFIHANYYKNITVSDISREVYLSPNYISIIFKKEIGESFTDYLIKFRLQKAIDLMKENNLKIYEIGDRVGYPNTSYFCSLFKKIYGVSPNEYRENF